MQQSSSRQTTMDKENTVEEGSTRITRARAKALGISGGLPPVPKPYLGAKTKRTASDDNRAVVAAVSGLHHKRRAVLKDATNIIREFSHGGKVQTGKLANRCPAKKNVEVADISMELSEAEEDVKTRLAEELSKIRMVEGLEIASPSKQATKQRICPNIRGGSVVDSTVLPKISDGLHCPQIEEGKRYFKKLDSSSCQGIVDIDSDQKDPQLCGLYASDIYSNRRVKELDQRPSTNYMERLQNDITPSMRGILIDWLVEVSEEYSLVPDTLYLTVNLIDRFLSKNFTEKQRLQLLGVTCMLISSKYEEICAPRVEEFCFITDNTYTKREVLKMESQVLNFLYFQISVPTTKTFLRRFIQAAQTCYKVPCIELEFLANYLAELTLVEYEFLKFLPSLIAASAVFLARWTLDQTDHPWNPTLGHYTSYNTSELKTAVLALEDLQLNTNGCFLNAIREKYRQQKFKCVATLTSPIRVKSLFEK